MVDRLQIADDTKNKVNKVTNLVTLSKPFLKKCENGHYIGRLLREMYATYSNRTSRSFRLPNSVTDVPQDLESFNQLVWNSLFEVLYQYGIKLELSKQEILVKTSNTQIVLDIVEALAEIDNSNTGQLGQAMKRKLGIKINNPTYNQAPQSPQQNLQVGAIRSDGQTFPDRRFAEAASPRKSSQLPLKMTGQLERVAKSARKNSALPMQEFETSTGMQRSPQNQFSARRASAVQSNLPQMLSPVASLPSRILGKESQLLANVRSDQLEEIMPQSLNDCKTSFQFVILTLMQSFQLKPKQAAALLTDNNKFLTHMTIKGTKGGDFDSIKLWYNILAQNAQLLIRLINTEKKDIVSYQTPLLPQTTKLAETIENRGKILMKTLNIIKGGFYSGDEEVQLLCGWTFFSIITEINQSYLELQQDSWDWLTTQTVKQELRRKKTIQPDTSSKLSIGSQLVSFEKNGSAAETKDLEALTLQTGLQAVLYAYQSNKEFLETASLILLSFAKIDPIKFFSQILRIQLPQWFVYIQLCTNIFVKTVGQQVAVEVFEQAGVLKYLVLESFKVADVDSQVSLNDRVTSTVFLTEVWLERPNYLDPLSRQSPEAMIQILKKGARDYQRTLCIESVLQMFRLLDKLAEQRHQFAPVIYKSLAFLLVEFFWEMDVREMMLYNFMKLYQNFDIIPINILLEPMLKQIETSQYHDSSFNVFDFDFFLFIAAHRKLTLPTGIQLADCISKIALSSVAFQLSATKVLVTLMQRFQGYTEFTNLWEQSFTQILQTIVNIQARLVIHRYHLRHEENNFFHRLALKNKNSVQPAKSSGRMSDQDYLVLKTNERLAVNLLQTVIRQQNYDLNEQLRVQMIDTFIAIQRELKVYCHAIAYLLKFFTNKVDSMIEQRSAQNPNAGSNIVFPFAEELQSILQTQMGSPNQGTVALYNSSNINLRTKNKIAVPALGVPQHEPTRVYQVSVALPLNSPEKKKTESSQLYDFRLWEEEWEIKQYQSFQKKHNRLYKELHRCYTYELSVKIPHAIARTTFEQHEKSIDQITSASLVKMIKDFKLENGMQANQLKEEIMRLVKQINLYILKQTVDVQTLTFEGFGHFLLQFAYLLWQFQTQNKAYQLIDRLFDHIKDQPQFDKIGLSVSKVETSTRKDVQTLLTLQQIKQQDPDFNLQDYKQVEDKVETVEHAVPSFFPMKQSKRIVVELLDNILSQCLGVHFLEPIQVETVTKKYLPLFVSRRTVPIPPSLVNKVRGNPANQPLSHEVVLSAAQVEAKEKYERAKQLKKTKRSNEQQQTSNYDDQFSKDSEPAINNVETYYYTRNLPGQKQPEIIQHRIVKLGLPQFTTEEDIKRATDRSAVKMISQQEQFKAQALNRRASKFGQAMQLSVIQANPLQQKQLIYECSEVLDEVLSAVEKGKKALRLDFTPYKLYDLHKERVKRQQQPIAEEDEQDKDEDVVSYKREAVQNFMSKQVSYLEQQKLSLFDQEEQRKKEERLKENKKRKMVEDYKAVAEATAAEKEAKKKQEQALKADKDRQIEAEQKQKQEELSRRLKESVKQHRQNLQLQQYENNLKYQEEESKQQMANLKQKAMAEKMTKIHKQKAADAKSTKNNAREWFFEFVKSSEIQQLINKTYQKSLIVKYDQCLKISQRTSGISQSGWLDWMVQQGVGTLVDPKLLVIVHGHQVREQEQGQDYSCVSQEYLKVAPGPPGDKEISFTGFVIAMIKVANLAKVRLRQQLNDESTTGKAFLQKQKLDEYMEYSLEDFSSKDVKSFFRFFKSL